MFTVSGFCEMYYLISAYKILFLCNVAPAYDQPIGNKLASNRVLQFRVLCNSRYCGTMAFTGTGPNVGGDPRKHLMKTAMNY